MKPTNKKPRDLKALKKTKLKNSENVTTTLYKIANAVNTTDNLDDLYKLIHKSLNHIIDASNFYIALYDKQNDTISFPYNVDLIDGILPDIKNVSQSNSLTNEVIQKGRPLFFKKEEMLALTKLKKLKVSTTPAELWLGVPLKTKNSVIGAIVLQSYDDPDIYDQKDMDLLIAVSDQVALAINRKLTEDAQKKSEEINRVLFAISNAANTASDLYDLYESIHISLSKIMDLSNFYIALYHKRKDCLTFPYFIDEVDPLDSIITIKNVMDPLSPSSTAWVIQSGIPRLFNKDYLIARMKEIGKELVGTPPAVWMGSPLKIKGQTIGVMVAQSYTNQNLYNEKDLEIFNSVSDQVALAIERKRAQDAEAENKAINKVLFSISNAVNTTENLSELYKSIHGTLRSVIDVTNFMIGIYDHKKDLISYPYYKDKNDDDHSDIHEVSKAGIIASEVINRAKPFFITKTEIIARAKKMNIKKDRIIPEQWLGIPLKIKREIIGVIVVQSYSNPERYSKKDAEILMAVSDQVAIAIDRKRSEEALAKSRKQIEHISNQTEQFSLTAASMISTNNPKDIFNKISRAIVKLSNYKRVVITYLTDQAPYHEILAYDGLEKKFIEKYRQAIIRPEFFNKFFKKGTGIGKFSVFIQSFELKKAYNEKLVLKNIKKIPDVMSDSWQRDDMLFVRMLDVSDNLIGFISVDDPKIIRRPTDETVRPLEIFSSLVSQIIINTKSQEELKTAKDAAEASAESKSEFLANMSHEIRTPMNAIMGLTELTLKTDLDLRQKDYLEKIKSSSTSLLGIINDILDFSKIDAGKMDIEKIDFKLDDVMDSLSDMFSSKTAEKNIELVISIANDVPLNLIGDPLRLRQALINLTGNAVKFTKKGEVIVSVSKVKSKGKNIKVLFSIKDTGIGIPKARLGKLFDSFVQADGSTTRKYGGTGLGLSISKKLIELMGGSIKVKSKAGKGAEFSFDITFKQQDIKPIEKTRIDTGLQDLKVLVVDDNKAARDIMDATLSSFHFNVKTIESGEKAIIELVKSDKAGKPYGLVILDLIMPGIDGIETAKRIRKNYNAFDIPIIMMTGFGREDTMQQAKKAKVNAFLMKPVKQSILLDTIMDIFGKKPDIPHIAETIETSDTSTEFAQLIGLNVLLAEDNNINQLVASKILEEVGIKVSIASTGLIAVKLLEKNKYDVVLMDIQMPEMDGYEATGVIRNKLKLKDLPIIAMTAHAMAGDREKCINAGMDDYISKPIDPDLLYSKLMKSSVSANANPSIVKEIDNKILQKKQESSIKPPDNLPDHLPGIDIKSGLERFMGNTELFIELLGSFIEENKDSASKIHTMIATNNIDEVLNYLHSIKGTAGNLSATKLYESSRRLESFIEKNSKADDILLKVYEKAFIEVSGSLKKINKFFKVSKADNIKNNESEFGKTDIESKLKFLHAKLLQNDLEALDAIHVVKNMIQEKVAKDKISALDKAINILDFDKAEVILSKIADTLKITLKGT